MDKPELITLIRNSPILHSDGRSILVCIVEQAHMIRGQWAIKRIDFPQRKLAELAGVGPRVTHTQLSNLKDIGALALKKMDKYQWLVVQPQKISRLKSTP